MNKFSPSQERAIECVESGANTFITGGAGTGKSFIIRHLASVMGIPVTATTGIAACYLRATTIHSWAKLGVGSDPADKIITNLQRANVDYGDRSLERLRETVSIIIDEVSMLSGEMLDLLSDVLKLARYSDEPFGGMRIVAVGDFFQLPAVNGSWAFESKAWAEAKFKVVNLETVFRQSDEDFLRVLNQARWGSVDNAAKRYLADRITESEIPGACELHTHNDGCDAVNYVKLDQVSGDGVTYWSNDAGKEKGTLDKSCLALDCLTLKPGARVMLITNLYPEVGLVNGSLGWVSQCRKIGTRPSVTVKFDNGVEEDILPSKWSLLDGSGVERASREQLPLRPAWAITIHKSQGMSLDSIRVSLEKCFAPGQAYVALSRAKTPEGLHIAASSNLDFDRIINAHPKVIQFYNQISQ